MHFVFIWNMYFEKSTGLLLSMYHYISLDLSNYDYGAGSLEIEHIMINYVPFEEASTTDTPNSSDTGSNFDSDTISDSGTSSDTGSDTGNESDEPGFLWYFTSASLIAFVLINKKNKCKL